MERLPMRKIRDALRLCAGGLSTRRIGQSLGVGRTTAGEYLRRAKRAGLGWPLPDDLTDAELERRLFRLPGGEVGVARTRPDWPMIHRELRRTGVTLSLLWEEYQAVHPDGHRRALLRGLEQAHRTAIEDHFDRNTRLGL